MPALYDATIPAFIRGLENLSAILEKGRVYADEKGMAHSELLDARLIEDMHPLTRQIQTVTDTPKGVATRVGQAENEVWTDEEATFEELQARLVKAIAYLQAVPAAGFEGREDARVTLPTPGGEIPFTGSSYVQSFAIPNFYFHLTTAYAILRSKGVPIGKLDFLGAVR